MTSHKRQRTSESRSNPSETTTTYDDESYDVGFDTPSIQDGFGGSAEPESPVTHSVSMNILQHFTEQNKLELDPSTAPKDGQLFSEVDEGGSLVTSMVGSPSRPFECQIGEDALFIGDYPWVSDIAQGGIGSCYLMAVLQTTTASAPDMIHGLFSDNGNTVTVNFKRFDGKDWVAAPITTDKSTIVAKNAEGNTEFQHGAGYRVATHPKKSEWFTDLTGEELCINLDTTYDMALWVPLLEKAYAEYAQTHGQYGGFRQRRQNDAQDEDGNNLSGIDIIEGGYEQLVMYTLFGDKIESRTVLDFQNETPGSTSVSPANQKFIEQLLSLDGQGLKQGETALLHASTGTYGIVENLQSYIPLVEAHFQSQESGMGRLGRQLGLGALGAGLLGEFDDSGIMPPSWYLDALRKACDAWMDPDNEDIEEEITNEISELCTHLINPELVPDLHKEDTSSTLTAFLEVAAQGSTSGTDNSNGQRFVYGGHAYAVYGANFKGSDGKPLALSLDTLSTQLSSIDTVHSTVNMGNPHATNEIDLHNTGPEDGVDDGAFTMTLDQFMRGFDSIQGGVVSA